MSKGHFVPKPRKNGGMSYQLVVELDPDPITGERNRRYKTVRCSKKEVNEELRKFQNEIDFGCSCVPSAMKVKDWVQQWLNQYLPNIEATTRAGYKDKIKNQIIPHLGHLPIKTLNANTVQKWINTLYMDHGLAPKTIRNAFLILNAAMEKAVVIQMIPHNPCKGVVLPKGQPYKARIYTKKEMLHLLDVARGTDMYLPVLLSCYVGFRRGELLALKWDSFDLDKGIIYVHSNTVIAEGKVITKAPKSPSGIRALSLGANLVAELKQARAQYNSNKLAFGAGFIDSGLVVCQPNGKPYRPDSMTQKWERFVKKHGLKHVRLHDLRHSCATLMIEAGIDMKTVQTRIGHANIATTMNIYAHCTPTMDQRAANKLDEILLA